MTDLSASKPFLPRGVRLVEDEARGGWTLLGPERVFRADAVSYEILRRCDGSLSTSQIVDDLARSFRAPRETIAGDVEAFLRSMAEKRMVEFT